MISALFLLTLIFRCTGAIQDAICNGNFEVYAIPNKYYYTNGQYIMWSNYPQNMSCWYRYPTGSGNLEFQTPSYAPFWTKVI